MSDEPGREMTRDEFIQEIRSLRAELATALSDILDLRNDRSCCVEARLEGVASVLMIRCVEHRHVAQLNTNEAVDGECGECARLEGAREIKKFWANCLPEPARSALLALIDPPAKEPSE